MDEEAYFFVKGAQKQSEYPQREEREEMQGDFIEPHKIFSLSSI